MLCMMCGRMEALPDSQVCNQCERQMTKTKEQIDKVACVLIEAVCAAMDKE